MRVGRLAYDSLRGRSKRPLPDLPIRARVPQSVLSDGHEVTFPSAYRAGLDNRPRPVADRGDRLSGIHRASRNG